MNTEIDPFALLFFHTDGSEKTEAEIAAESAAVAVEAKTWKVAPVGHIRPASEVPPCKKCNGLGYLAHYGHIANGECFRCGGSGVDPKAPR